jgi:hypothetical protein
MCGEVVIGLVIRRRSSDAHQNTVEWVLAADREGKVRVEGQSN